MSKKERPTSTRLRVMSDGNLSNLSQTQDGGLPPIQQQQVSAKPQIQQQLLKQPSQPQQQKQQQLSMDMRTDQLQQLQTQGKEVKVQKKRSESLETKPRLKAASMPIMKSKSVKAVENEDDDEESYLQQKNVRKKSKLSNILSKSKKAVKFNEEDDTIIGNRPLSNERHIKNYGDTALLKTQENMLKRTLEERRKDYKTKMYVTLAQIPKWSQIPEDSVGYEPMIVIPNDLKSMKGPMKPLMIQIPLPKENYSIDDGLNEMISLYNGSITDLEVDVIVTTTDRNLNETDFVQIIVDAGGKEISTELAYVRRHRNEANINNRFMDAAFVCGYRLPAYYVIFVPFPVSQTEATLTQCYERALNTAVHNNQRSIAIPCIATGGFGKRLMEKLATTFTNIREVDRIVFCVYEDANLAVYKKCLPLYFPRNLDKIDLDYPNSMFQGKNYIPITFINDQESMLKKCQKLSFSGNLLITDAIFWKIASLYEKSSNSANPIKELNCSACIYLTDGCSYALGIAFPNLQKLRFDGCDKITERSAINIVEKCKELEFASFRSCSVRMVPADLISSKKFDFFGCPVSYLKNCLVEKSDTLRKYKIVIVRGQNDESLISKNDKKSTKPLWDFKAVDNFNVYECDSKLFHNVVTPGSIIVIISQDLNVIETITLSALKLICPIIISSHVDSQIVEKIRKILEKRLSVSNKLLMTDMNFVEQEMFANLKLVQYMLNVPNIINPSALVELKNFKSETYSKAVNFVDANFPELNLCNKLNFNEILTKCKSERLELFHSRELFSKIRPLSLQGEILLLLIPDTKTYAYYEPNLVVKISNEISAYKNKDVDGKLIPWLPDTTCAMHYSQLNVLFEKLQISKEKIDVMKLCVFSKFLIKVIQPWLNDICPVPSCFHIVSLPEQPAFKIDTYWSKFCTDGEQEFETLYRFSLQPPALFIRSMLYHGNRLGNVVTMWSHGFVIHYGCIEILLHLKNTKESDELEWPELKLCLRTIKLQKTNVNDVSLDQAENNLRDVLSNAFTLFRQYIFNSLLNCQTLATETLKCQKCARKNKLHYLVLWGNAVLECDGEKLDPKDLGILGSRQCSILEQELFRVFSKSKEGFYNENIIAHKDRVPCYDQAFQRCVMCNERFENMGRVATFCNKAVDAPASDACYTCSNCINVLENQNIRLNQLNWNDMNKAYRTFENRGILYEMKSGPLVICIIVKDISITITPIEITGKVVLLFGPHEVDLMSLCPNNESITVRFQYTLQDALYCYIHEASSNIWKPYDVFYDDYSFKILFVEKPASLLLLSRQPINPCIQEIQVGTILEAVRQDDPDHVYIAKIDEINEKGQLLVKFDSNRSDVHYYANVNDVKLHPIGYCYKHNTELMVRDYEDYVDNDTTRLPQLSKASLNPPESLEYYLKYIDTKNEIPVSNLFFSQPQMYKDSKECSKFDPWGTNELLTALLMGGKCILPDKFKAGMKLEVLDKRPNRNKSSRFEIIRNVVATIKSVNYDENRLVAELDVDGESNITQEYSLLENEIHPIGYTQSRVDINAVNAASPYALITPRDFKEFTWLSYVSDSLFRDETCLPAPIECFTKEQAGFNKLHIIYSFFGVQSDKSENSISYRCIDLMTINKIKRYCSSYMLDIRETMNTISGGGGDRWFGFLLLPENLKSDQDILYPRRGLVHQFENLHKQRLLAVMFIRNQMPNFERFGEALKVSDIDDRLNTSCCLVPSSINSLVDFLPSSDANPVKTGKSKSSKDENSKESSLYQFMNNYYYELICYVATVVRYKLDMNAETVKVFFPDLTNVNLRQCLEGLQRYCSLYLSTLMTVFSTNDLPAYQIEGAQMKIINQNLMEVFSTSISAETILNIMPRSLLVGTAESQKSLEEYNTHYNRTVVAISRTYNFSSIAPLIPTISQFRSLTSLSLFSCQPGLKEFNIDTTYLSHSLLTLTLDENPLKTFPESIFGLLELRKLNLVMCGIRTLPDKFDKLQKLMELNVSYNPITAIPKSFSNLNLFKIFILDAVKLYSMGSTITFDDFMKMGQKLYFPSFENKTPSEVEEMMAASSGIKSFSTVPVEQQADIAKLNSFLLQECPRFESLSSSPQKSSDFGAGLEHGFPLEILSMQSLEILSLACQNISQIPDNISSLVRLKQLNLRNCPYLKEVSPQIAGIDPFEQINLTGCTALVDPPQDVVRRGMDSVIGHLKKSLLGRQVIRRTKLMIVGLGGAGKTKFVEALQNEKHCTDEEDSPDVTDGIDTCEWIKKVDQDTEITYVIWDFAGQSVYYNTHQFFLSKRAVYCLLWNSRLGYENAGLEFWLSSIACHAPEEPIFVVATHADQINHIEIPMAELKEAYPQIVHFAHISSITGFGMENLVNKIVEVTLAQKYINAPVPIVYLLLEVELNEKKTDVNSFESRIMPFEKVKEKAKPLGLITQTEIKEALNYLHELGSVQYFSNDVLKEHVVLQPQWLVDAMACLISVKASVITDGRFDRKDISIIWSDYPPELHDWLLRLTEEFDLTFALPSDNINIVPCMLPDVEPQIDWFEIDNKSIFEMKMMYKFDYLPAGLFNRSQSRLCQYSEGSKVWKKGSLLNKNNHLALVRQLKDKELSITVQGPRPENVLYLIHEVIETLIHDFFQGVNYDVLLPCPDCTKGGSQDVHMFSSKQVKRATDLKAPFLQCAKLFHIVSLARMHAVMPPSSMSDYEQHIMRMVQDMNDLKQVYICLMCCSSNVIKQKKGADKQQICIVTKLLDRLQSEKIACTLVELNDDKTDENFDDFGFKLSNASLLLLCISPEFCNSKKCADVFAYIRQSNRPVLFSIIGKGQDWKTSSIGLQIASEVYYDFQKTEYFDTKFNDLLNKIKIKTAKPKVVSYSSIFFSYSWLNSKDATEKGRTKSEKALGEVDPRQLADTLQNDLKLDIWIDYKQPDLGALFEDIADALRHSQLFIACVSDEYMNSQNCRREFRFASAAQIPKIICVVGRGDVWQKSEINLLALDASIYNFKIKSDETYKDLLTKITEILKVNQPLTKNLGDKTSKSITNKSKPVTDSALSTSSDSVEKNLTAYQELTELTQRKLLQQASSVASKLRSTDIFFSKPYPRVFFVDVCPGVSNETKIEVDKTAPPKGEQPKMEKIEQKMSKTTEKKDKNKNTKTVVSKVAAVERPRSVRPKSAGTNLWDAVDPNDICFKWLCEYEGGWHTVGDPLLFTNSADSYSGTLSDLLDIVSTYQSQMLNMLQHTPVVVEMLQHKRGQEFLNDLKLRANNVGPEGFEVGYKFLYRLIRQLDTSCKRGGMERCYLYSKKIIWLCPEHRKLARGVLADDDLDADDVAISFEDSDDVSGGLQTKNSDPQLLSRKTENQPMKSVKPRDTADSASSETSGKKPSSGMYGELVGRSSDAGSRSDTPSNQFDESRKNNLLEKNPQSKACEIM